MIILQRLLSSLLLSFLLGSMLAYASEPYYCSRDFEVIERTKKSKYMLTPVTLEKLYCNNTFEGEHFKIVYSTEDKPISFDHEDKALILKAANVYHHLTIARNFWVDEIKSEFVTTMPQITIRLDITNGYSSTRQFKHAEQEKNHNNAWSIPAGQTPRFAEEQKKWFKEIWFSPMKKVESRKEVKSKGDNPVHQSLLLVKEPVTMMNTNALIFTGLGAIRYPSINGSLVLDNALISVGTIAVLFGLIETTKHMDKLFTDKYYFIDTALIPEVIYHEYAHIAMSDTMKTVHSVPVIEGMADYFAARISNRKKMYSELKKISNNRAKNPDNNSLYSPYLEGHWNAHADFTLGVLWRGKLEFEKINEQRLAKGQPLLADYDNLVFEAHKSLNEYSDIANDLTKALLDSCREVCSSLRPGLNTLQYVFEQKGFN